MNVNSEYLENTWDEILSRNPTRIRRALNKLDVASQNVITRHLNTMVSEEGWQEVQIASAKHALKALSTIDLE